MDGPGVGDHLQIGGGLLFSTGNYAGDVMNFNLAQERLQAEGIDTRNVYVTDDVGLMTEVSYTMPTGDIDEYDNVAILFGLMFRFHGN